MVAWNIYSRTIRRAAELLGKEALASRLNVSVGTIDRWIKAERLPAIRYFLAAVDILDEHVFVRGPEESPFKRGGDSSSGSSGEHPLDS